MTRTEVYSALDSERDFQDAETARPDRPDMVSHLSMGDILTAMEVNLRKAQAAWYRDATPYQATMAFVRKVGGLTVKAGEQFGMPVRE